MNENTDPLLTDRESAALLSVSLSTFWRLVRSGTAPKPIKLGFTSRWPKSEILNIIEVAKARRGEAA